jgi:hypothetical membrane protein
MKLNRQPIFVGIGLSLVCLLQIQCTLGRGLSTAEERAKAIEIARSLERDPLAADAPQNRQWLLTWMTEVPDIRFNACDGLLRPGVEGDYRYATQINQQVIFSAAAFKLEDAGHLRDNTGATVAGVEGALRAYEVLLKSAPDAKSHFLDDLLAKRDRGELAGYVTNLAKEKCKRPKFELIVSVAGAGVGLILGLLVGHITRRRESHAVVSTSLGAAMQRVVVLCAAYYVIALIILHILQPEFDPRFRFMSEYALGDYGWLMTTTFFVLGVALFAAAAALRSAYSSSRSGRVGFGLLAVAGVFVCLAGVFRDSLPHLLASVVVFPSVVLAALILSWSFRKVAAWHTIFVATFFIALALLGLFISMVADVGMPGLQQRAFIFLLLLWLSIVVHRMARVTGTS